MNELKGDLPEDFKMTELGPLPEEWEVVRLGDVAVTYSGGTPSRNQKEYFEGEIGWLKSGELNDNYIYSTKECITEEALKYSSTKYVENDTLLIAMYGATSGKVGLAKTKFTINQAICAIKPNSKFCPEFYFFYFQTIRDGLLSMRFGGAQPNLNQQIIKNLKIPLPPLPEQRKIAAVLSTIQKAKEKTEAVISAAQDLKKSMMSYLFTYGPVPVVDAENVPLKETEIGMIPEEWEVVRLGDLIDKGLIRVQFGFPCGKWNDKSFGIAQIRPFNITNDGNIDLQTLKYIETDKDISKYVLQEEDIIFNNTNSEELVGKTAYWKYKNNKFVLSNHMTIIRVISKDELCAALLAKYLHKKWNDGLYKTICRRHVNQSSISLARLGSIKIIFPPLPTQQKIASMLSAIDEKIEAEENKKKALEDLFKTLLYNLMTAKIRVNNLEVGV